jgi:hypothetical protein
VRKSFSLGHNDDRRFGSIADLVADLSEFLSLIGIHCSAMNYEERSVAVGEEEGRRRRDVGEEEGMEKKKGRWF